MEKKPDAIAPPRYDRLAQLESEIKENGFVTMDQAIELKALKAGIKGVQRERNA